MATKDQNKNIAGKQNVKTHTVAFALKSAGPVQFLKDVANLGGGGFYSADTAGDLQDVFKVILSDVRSAPSSFAAPALAIDAFNKLTSRSDVYYGMFTPELTQRWNGNIKKYKLCLNDGCGKLGDVLDANDNSVVDSSDPDRPVFKTDSRSVWSSIQDGQAVTKGGAGAEITVLDEVTLVTDKKDATSSFEDIKGKVLSTETGFFIKEANWNDGAHSTIRSVICKQPSTADGSECEKRMLWMLGKKHVTDAENDVNQNQRWSVGDVLHSSPVVITYGGTTGTTPTFIDRVVYGTNAGYLHMVNGKTGKEEWRYMPSDFWPAQRQLFDNRQDSHMYGMDSTPTVWMCDALGDGTIQVNGQGARGIKTLGKEVCGGSSGDFVRVITSTRRGGGANGFIYALDLSPDSAPSDNFNINPMFMWRIAGGNTTGDFRRLGQTWSQPRITTIVVNEEPKDVLIFGGGYDIKLDDSTKFSTGDNDGNDYLGNAIYIVDPMDGKKILSISGKGSGADIEVEDMHFSIPSRIEFLDSNIDGLTDRLYVGDLGGQVWRVDLAKTIPTSTPSDGTVVGLLAQISGNAALDRRRFFEPPSIVQVSDALFADEPEYDYVLMGSGNRPNPLEETVKDRFYAFRDRVISNNGLDVHDVDSNHVAETGYPDTTSSAYSHADSASLINVTQKGMAELAAVDEALVKDSNGWFIDYAEANAGRAGEKTLSSPLTAGGAVSFTTFDPITETTTGSGTGGTTAQQANKKDPCSASPNIGTARAYHLTILGADVPEITEVGGGRGANRYRKVIGSGIPSDVIPVFTEQGVIGIVQSDGVPTSLGQLSATTPERAYWNESIDF
jgi:type IV pilus assembly protein PilY1